MKILIEQNADINRLNDDGNTPLAEAVLADQLEIIHFLLDNNCDVGTHTEGLSYPPVSYYFTGKVHVTEKHLTIIEKMLQETSSFSSCLSENALLCKAVKVCISKYIMQTCTPMFRAISFLLRIHNCKLDMSDSCGQTILHYICQHAGQEEYYIVVQYELAKLLEQCKPQCCRQNIYHTTSSSCYEWFCEVV